MRDIIVVLVIGFLLSKAYESYEKKHQSIPDNITTTTQDLTESNQLSTSSTQKSNFKCDGRTHCSHMNSCEEATFFLQNCPSVEMDGDNDGQPCERQWCN